MTACVASGLLPCHTTQALRQENREAPLLLKLEPKATGNTRKTQAQPSDKPIMQKERYHHAKHRTHKSKLTKRHPLLSRAVCFASEHHVHFKNHLPWAPVHQVTAKLPAGIGTRCQTVTRRLASSGTSSRAWSREQSFAGTCTRGGSHGVIGLKGGIRLFLGRLRTCTRRLLILECSCQKPTPYKVSLISTSRGISQGLTIVEAFTGKICLSAQN